MDLIYMDFNCFQRGFDDPTQVRIQMEALACQEIFRMAEENKVALIWSFMHAVENDVCPFNERRQEAIKLSALCKKRIGVHEAIYDLSEKLDTLDSKDALHLATALYIQAGFFITCDDILIKKSMKLDLEIKFLNPLEYWRWKT
jgi:predicted nucleic acid-binding protein